MRALIINGDKKKRINPERWENAFNLCSFLGKELDFECHRTPAVFTSDAELIDRCGNQRGKTKLKQYQLGCKNAHREALLTAATRTDKTLIFEDDIAMPDASPDVAVANINSFLQQNETTDVAFVGHCGGGYCMHAYAVTPEAAKKIMSNVDWCNENPIDHQLVEKCRSGLLSCAYAETMPTVKEEGSDWDSRPDGLTQGGILKQSGPQSYHPADVRRQ